MLPSKQTRVPLRFEDSNGCVLRSVGHNSAKQFAKSAGQDLAMAGGEALSGELQNFDVR